MKKIIIALILLLSIAIIPCVIEVIRTGDYSFFPGLIASIFLSPAAIIYLLLSETKIKLWILRSILGIYAIFPLAVGVGALDTELHGPLFGYWILPATVIFIPVILITPSLSYYKKTNPQPAGAGQPDNPPVKL
jgi:hypothetical protein